MIAISVRDIAARPAEPLINIQGKFSLVSGEKLIISTKHKKLPGAVLEFFFAGIKVERSVSQLELAHQDLLLDQHVVGSDALLQFVPRLSNTSIETQFVGPPVLLLVEAGGVDDLHERGQLSYLAALQRLLLLRGGQHLGGSAAQQRRAHSHLVGAQVRFCDASHSGGGQFNAGLMAIAALQEGVISRGGYVVLEFSSIAADDVNFCCPCLAGFITFLTAFEILNNLKCTRVETGYIL
jgi:hypothetical protein